jgi:hypothetical protein
MKQMEVHETCGDKEMDKECGFFDKREKSDKVTNEQLMVPQTVASYFWIRVDRRGNMTLYEKMKLFITWLTKC